MSTAFMGSTSSAHGSVAALSADGGVKTPKVVQRIYPFKLPLTLQLV